MLEEVLKIASVSKGGKFIDCTFGGGNFSKEILKYSSTFVEAMIETNKSYLKLESLKKNFLKDLNFIK